MTEWLGSHDHWPRHSRPDAAAALADARASGWFFRATRGHAFGRLRCTLPGPDSPTDVCSVPIYSTSGSADGSETARVIRDALRKCHHQRGSVEETLEPAAAARQASGALARAAALIEAAEELCAKAAAEARASGVIESAIRGLEAGASDVADLEQELRAAEEIADHAARRAHTAALRVDAADPWPPAEGAQELVDQARIALDEAVGLIARAGDGHPDASGLGASLRQLRDRVDSLSTRL